MSPWKVTIVTAFGRGESLALMLADSGFTVRILDFTPGLPKRYGSGPGPFPILQQMFLPSQKPIVTELQILSRGICFWLPSGPIELAGPMASFYQEHNPAVMTLVTNEEGADFESDWMRKWMHHWVSPYYCESWQRTFGRSFSGREPLGFWNEQDEKDHFSFTSFKSTGGDYSECSGLVDMQAVGSRLVEIEAESKRSFAEQSEQWIWQLSTHETRLLNPRVAETLFGRDVREPTWHWMCVTAELSQARGPTGMPDYGAMVEDLYQPWTHENVIVWRWLTDFKVQLWLKVPASYWEDEASRRQVLVRMQSVWEMRMPGVKWKFDFDSWWVNPACAQYPLSTREWSLAHWKNWNWISPESDGRVDFAARLESGAQAYHRLIQWRNDLVQKQGEKQGDSEIHAP